MPLSIAGLNSPLALKLIDATWDKQVQQLSDEAVHKRAVDSFRERIGSITTPEELVKDYEVYSMVMRAFDLEDQIFGKGMIRRILESDPAATDSLVNRMTDSRFGRLHEALGFVTTEGNPKPDFSDPVWQQEVIDQYLSTVLSNLEGDQNPTIGTVLALREQAPELTSWYDVLKNKALSEFFRTVLSLPSQMAGLDVDKQAEILGQKYDLSRLADPQELDRLVTRYMAISDVLNPPAAAPNNLALSLLKNSASSIQIVSLQLDSNPVKYSASLLYR